MFSKACEYGIRAMIYIAQQSRQGERVGLKDVAQGIDSPEAFMAKILQALSRQGLVQSVKGPNGGFYMDAPGLKVTLAEVVLAIDGDQLFTGCGLGLPECNEKKPCPIHDEFKLIRNKIKSLLETTQVGEFNELLEKGVLHLKRV
ncbi:RrF2 family transcriptional regulator [Parachryseolinea silvisoli]|uniref:RrF2 family transcriptional regulator n=1 Tax=Parachryseolinea silvisoli TaxID=2873601 RepID=UPI002265CD87|nr:Rrf2 family transcriptional regulator [Parachryseolinea silvisoli]MCD9016766.1 Rrf2 family transcriptional regulator [Parachryseolinea silvisoli]